MRQITNLLPRNTPTTFRVLAADESGFGQPCYRYEINGFALDTNPFRTSDATAVDVKGRGNTTILFHRGPLAQEIPPNGVSVQSLLAAIGDELQNTSTTDGQSDVDMTVLENLRKAVHALNMRDQRLRMNRTAQAVLDRVPALN